MAKNPLPNDVVRQLKAILGYLFNDGQKWLKTIAMDDWRRQYTAGTSQRRRSLPSGPTMDHFSQNVEHLISYIAKAASSETAAAHEYCFVVRPEKVCANDRKVAIVRPVLKTNIGNEPFLNFHIWFHGISPEGTNEHLVFGWRLEGPEGDGTTHDYYHAQPLKRFGRSEKAHGMPPGYPEKFPTIPLPATSQVELCLTALLIACGKDSLRSVMRNSEDLDVRKCARGFWAKLFVKKESG